MAQLKARIIWQVFNDNGGEVSSSYVSISDIVDAQAWVDYMEDLLEDASGKEN